MKSLQACIGMLQKVSGLGILGMPPVRLKLGITKGPPAACAFPALSGRAIHRIAGYGLKVPDLRQHRAI